MTNLQTADKIPLLAGIFLLALMANPAMAQEVRYSYLDMSFMAQDVGESGSQTPVPGQTVDYSTSDGNGIRFRGSVGTWHNMYLFIDYSSTDIDLSAFVVSPLIPEGQLALDEFDLTTVRSGIGLKHTFGRATDAFVELTYDSSDYDFGSFVLENFDTGEKDLGARLGVRHMLNDNVEVRGWGRYSNVADVDLDTLNFDADTLFGVGFGWQVVRGFSIVGDFESGISDSWNIGFRLDLDED